MFKVVIWRGDFIEAFDRRFLLIDEAEDFAEIIRELLIADVDVTIEPA